MTKKPTKSHIFDSNQKPEGIAGGATTPNETGSQGSKIWDQDFLKRISIPTAFSRATTDEVLTNTSGGATRHSLDSIRSNLDEARHLWDELSRLPQSLSPEEKQKKEMLELIEKIKKQIIDLNL